MNPAPALHTAVCLGEVSTSRELILNNKHVKFGQVSALCTELSAVHGV